MVKNGNYIVIQGFMVNELNLKGNDLLVYAIIYGFSQTANNWFTGSLQYLADWTNSTKRGIQKNLDNLINKKLIEKKTFEKNNVKFCEYRNLYGIEQSSTPMNCKTQNQGRGIEQSSTGYRTEFHGGIEQSSTNNIDNNIDNIKKEKKEPPTRNFNQIIESYTNNQELQEKIKSLLPAMKYKGALNINSLKLLLKDLDTYANGNDEIKIKMLEYSIRRGYPTVYAPKESETNSNGASYSIEEYENYSVFDEDDWEKRFLGA